MCRFTLGKKSTWWQGGLLLVLAGVSLAGGCTRRFYRRQADTEVMALLHEKDKDPRWTIGMYSVYPDPRSRFGDQERWDRPPMPPDDPAAKLLSPNPQRPPHHAGVAYTESWGYMRLLEQWDEQNRADEGKRKTVKRLDPYEGVSPKEKKLIGPAGPTPPVLDALNTYELQNEMAEPVGRAGLLPPEERQASKKKKPFKINLPQAIELAQINSRELQTAREELYLAALPVTLERFTFATQGYAFNQLFRQYFGPQAPAGPQNDWVSNTNIGFTKLFSTGALLLMQFANQTVVNLGTLAGGVPTTISQSTINLDIVQPFFQGGGRAVTLEPLTQAERNLLYAVRDYARFRQGFYSFIAVGQAAFIVGQAAGVQALPTPTVSPASPSFPFANPLVTPLGFSVPVQVPPESVSIAGAVPPLGANPTGYVQTLLQKVQQVIARKNLNSYEYFLKLFEVWKEGGLVNPVQVGTVEQRYLAAIETHLTQWVQYRQFLDLFRIQLGLPATVNVELDDGPIQPMYDLIDLYENNSIAYAMAVNQAGKLGTEDPKVLRQHLKEVMTKSALVQGLPFQKEAVRRWVPWEKRTAAAITAKVRELKEERRKLLDRKTELELRQQKLSEPEQTRWEQLNYDIDLADFEIALRAYEAQPWSTEKDKARREKKQADMFTGLHRIFAPLLAPAVAERLDEIRRAWPPLPPVFVGEVDLLSADDDTTLDTVVQTAFRNRLDLMNQRAQLVDAWRKLRVVANSLLGVFNVEYHLQAFTPAGLDAPFSFSESRTQHQLAFNSQLPIVRRAQRNNYRSALIAYQQQRRSWMDAQDQIAFAVRFQVRNLRIAAYNYQKVQRRNMELAYQVVDQSLQAFNQPAIPTGGGGAVSPPGGQPTAADPAALTNQLLGAQGTLVAAQNDLFNQWLGYFQSRIGLYRDMGLMPLDDKGIWIDDVSYYRPSGTSDTGDQHCVPYFLPGVAPGPFYGDDPQLPQAVPPPVPAEPEQLPPPVPAEPEPAPPPARLLSPTNRAPQRMP
jgi:hypothetical protein